MIPNLLPCNIIKTIKTVIKKSCSWRFWDTINTVIIYLLKMPSIVNIKNILGAECEKVVFKF